MVQYKILYLIYVSFKFFYNLILCFVLINYTIKDFLHSYPITFRHYDNKICKYRIKGELYHVKDDSIYESVTNMELNAGYTLVHTLVELEDGTEHVAEMFLVEDTPAKITTKEVLSDFRVRTIKNVKEWCGQ